jgi:hypothetical protein
MEIQPDFKELLELLNAHKAQQLLFRHNSTIIFYEGLSISQIGVYE